MSLLTDAITRLKQALPEPKHFMIRSRQDLSGIVNAAAHRDRHAILDDLKANEEERYVEVRSKPKPRQRPFTPPPQISGFEYVDKVRSDTPLRRVPPALTQIWRDVEFDFDYENQVPNGFMYLSSEGVIKVQPHKKATQNNWTFYTLHLLYHLALGYLKPPDNYPDPLLWIYACEMLINQFAATSTFIQIPQGFPSLGGFSRFALFRPVGSTPKTPEELILNWQSANRLPDLTGLSWFTPAGEVTWDVFDTDPERVSRYRSIYLLEQVRQMQNKMQEAQRRKYADTTIARAFRWIENHFPLLSATAAHFEIDYESAEKYDIVLGAVSARDQIIFVNPNAEISELEWRWVLVHEILHVVLEHQRRCADRHQLLWNVACDYVINNWLEVMGVGMRPKGVLFKAEYRGKDAETIYDELLKHGGNDQVKLVTFRGEGMGDIMDFDSSYNNENHSRFASRFRPNVRQMTQNSARKMLEDESNGIRRGTLPADLVEELDLGGLLGEHIEVPEWKVELAQWLNLQLTPKLPRRTYTRLSRRMAATPDIPLPGKANLERHSPTFGVVLDTSGSMSHELLQRGLAAVVAFAGREGVARIRFVMCDTRPYDEGFIPIERLKRPYRIMGRGGTILQPSIDLLEQAHNFPDDAPILIITDGEIDILKVTREHAYLLPGDGKLPFEPSGPVFRILGEHRSSPFRRFGPPPAANAQPEARPSSPSSS